MTTEYRDLQRSVARFEAAFSKKVESLEAEIDWLRLEIAERDRRLARYENPNASSSTDSLYNEERTAFRKRMERERTGAGRVADLNRRAVTQEIGHAGGRPRGTRENPTGTGPKGRSRCA